VTTKNFTLNSGTQSHAGHNPYYIGVLSRVSRFVRDTEGQLSRIVPHVPLRRDRDIEGQMSRMSPMSRLAAFPPQSLNLKEPTMNMLTKFFTAAFQFFRPAAKAVAPASAGTQSWLTAPASQITWEEALSGAARRQQAEPTIR
jgi:hypothetical protein